MLSQRILKSGMAAFVLFALTFPTAKADDGFPFGDISPEKVLTTAAGAGEFDATALVESNIKKGVEFGEESSREGTLAPNGGSAAASAVFDGETVFIDADWTLDVGTLKKACKVDNFNGNDNKVDDARDGNGNGNNRWCITESGTALESDIFNGEIAWVDGEELTGTLNLACNVSIFNSVANLVPNRHDGAGNGTNRWCMTDSGTATAAQIAAGEVAWVDGSAVTGTMANVGQQNVTPTTTDITITQGYHDGTGKVAGDADLIAGNIKSGVNLFGVSGSLAVYSTLR